jgi:hypothetical protein
MDLEMGNVIRSIPLSAGREVRPAASIEEIRDLLQGAKDPATGGPAEPGLSPQILHISSHGSNFEGEGYLAFVRDDGKGRLSFRQMPPEGSGLKPDKDYYADADALIQIIKSIHGKKRLECIFLNACYVLDTMGKKLHDAFPDVAVVGFSTTVENKASTDFAKGFYERVGSAIQSGKPCTAKDAYDAAVKAWNDGGHKIGDPAIPSAVPAFTKADVGKWLYVTKLGSVSLQDDMVSQSTRARRLVYWPVDGHGNSLRPGELGWLKISSVEEAVGGLVELEIPGQAPFQLDNPHRENEGIFGIHEAKTASPG